MKKNKKVFLTVLLCVTLCFSSTLNIFASDEEITEKVVQENVNTNDIDATAISLSTEEYTQIWNQSFMTHEAIEELMDSLENDGFEEIQEYNNMAVKITDNEDPSLFVYYYFKCYKNDLGETVFSMFVYHPQTDSMLNIWAEKIDSSGASNNYYDFSEYNVPKTRDFNTISFLCSMTSKIACASYSAMLFALPIAAGLVGLGCEVAFWYVCSYT